MNKMIKKILVVGISVVGLFALGTVKTVKGEDGYSIVNKNIQQNELMNSVEYEVLEVDDDIYINIKTDRQQINSVVMNNKKLWNTVKTNLKYVIDNSREEFKNEGIQGNISVRMLDKDNEETMLSIINEEVVFDLQEKYFVVEGVEL